jgi:SAM-dependent methyltransferase
LRRYPCAQCCSGEQDDAECPPDASIEKAVKDNFSGVSPLYAEFRPSYPIELFDFFLSLVPGRSAAWDCGTGNGQLAGELAVHFEKVYGTDISKNQIRNAIRKENILYSLQPVEHTSFLPAQFDLAASSQAAHWFNLRQFYAEVDRVLKPEGILALIGYSHAEVDDKIDRIILGFKDNILGPYWDEERRLVDERYRMIPFPYPEIDFPPMNIRYQWNLRHLLGYLHTWSAVQHYVDSKHTDPVQHVAGDLATAWGGTAVRTVSFPLFGRIGRKTST